MLRKITWSMGKCVVSWSLDSSTGPDASWGLTSILCNNPFGCTSISCAWLIRMAIISMPRLRFDIKSVLVLVDGKGGYQRIVARMTGIHLCGLESTT